MELYYQGKKRREDILMNIISNEPYLCDIETSNLFKGDNIKILGKIFSSYQNKIDLIYIDPPFNTNQEFVSSYNRTSTISRVNEGELAYSDKMNEEDYIEFIRERLIILRELLSEEGSIYFHIDVKIGHYIKVVMDEIFGKDNFKNDITRIKSNPKNFSRRAFGNQKDVILFYAKNAKKNIFNNVVTDLSETDKIRMFKKIDDSGRRYNTVPVHAPGETRNGVTGQEWNGLFPPPGRHWRMSPKELDELDNKGLIEWSKNNVPRIKNYADEHKGKKIQDTWDFKDPAYPNYPTEKNLTMLKMIVSQSSHLNSIVLDCFAGGGSTLFAAEQLGRKWIGMDKSDLSIEAIKKRMINVDYSYNDLSDLQ